MTPEELRSEYEIVDYDRNEEVYYTTNWEGLAERILKLTADLEAARAAGRRLRFVLSVPLAGVTLQENDPRIAAIKAWDDVDAALGTTKPAAEA